MSNNTVALNELSQFLDPQGRLDLKSLALQTLLSLTASKEGRHLILTTPTENLQDSLLTRIARLIFEDEQEAVRFDSLLFLINLTSDQELSIFNHPSMSIQNEFWLKLLQVSHFQTISRTNQQIDLNLALCQRSTIRTCRCRL